MAKEIERKFLVRGDTWRSSAKGTAYRQGYLNSAKERTVRVRIHADRSIRSIKLSLRWLLLSSACFGTFRRATWCRSPWPRQCKS